MIPFLAASAIDSFASGAMSLFSSQGSGAAAAAPSESFSSVLSKVGAVRKAGAGLFASAGPDASGGGASSGNSSTGSAARLLDRLA